MENKEPVKYPYRFDEEKHIHLYMEKPLLGTSTILNVLAKPLTWWASGLAVAKFGWLNSKLFSKEDRLAKVKYFLSDMDFYISHPEKWLQLCDDAYKAHSVKLEDSAQSGTDLHAELEHYVKEHMTGFLGTTEAEVLAKLSPHVTDFASWVNINVDKFIWSEVNCFDDELWVGGISDCGVKLKDGKVGIIDFKSSKEAYESQFIQCGGYDIQLSKNGGFTKEGYQLFEKIDKIDFYCIIPFGAKTFSPTFRYNVDELKESFKATLTIYKLLNK